MNNYLWDRSGDPDEEIVELENLLGTLKHEGPAPEVETPQQQPSRRAKLLPLMAAAVLLAATVGVLTLQTGEPGSESDYVAVEYSPEPQSVADEVWVESAGPSPTEALGRQSNRAESEAPEQLAVLDPYSQNSAAESHFRTERVSGRLPHAEPERDPEIAQALPTTPVTVDLGGAVVGGNVLAQSDANQTGQVFQPSSGNTQTSSDGPARDGHQRFGEGDDEVGDGTELGGLAREDRNRPQEEVVLRMRRRPEPDDSEGQHEATIAPDRTANLEQAGEAIAPGLVDSDIRGGEGVALNTGLQANERYGEYRESPFVPSGSDNLATFSIDVDTASYSLMRSSITRNVLPTPIGVRAEEYINYFDYDYPAPAVGDEEPFAIHLESAPSPFGEGYELVRVAVQGAKISEDARPPANLVFLIDVSGSMNSPDKLGLVQYSLRRLTETLRESDTIGIVVYAGRQGVLLEPTAVENRDQIIGVIEALSAGGGTNGEAGIRSAYNLATSAFRPGGINRVIWCSDGDLNVGLTGEPLIELIESQREREVYLTTLGFGRGNYNDQDMEQFADRGNGNYSYIDGETEAERVMVESLSGTLHTIAEDVKIQVAFDTDVVRRYRRIGYDNRVLQDWEFTDDTVDAGEVGAGQNVTAFLEIELQPGVATLADSHEMVEVRVRYKYPHTESSIETRRTLTVGDRSGSFLLASRQFRFATAVSEFAEILRHSSYSEGAQFEEVYRVAAGALDPHDEHQREFLELVLDADRLWRGYDRPRVER